MSDSTAAPNPSASEQVAGARSSYGDLTGWLTSLATHALGLVLLATATMLGPLPQVSLLVDAPPPLEEEPPEDAFRVSEALMLDVGALSDNGAGDAAAAAPLEAVVAEVSLDMESIADQGALPTIELPTTVVASPDPKSNLMVQGVGAVGTSGSSGAVDRLTGEILRSLEQAPTLVVWLFDRSASLRTQREEIVGRFDRVYQQLGTIKERDADEFDHEEEPLLTAVGGFGREVTFYADRPSPDVEAHKEAIRGIDEDDSGAENVFAAILETLDKYKAYRTRRPRRNLMLIVVTDEAGDDPQLLDRAVDRCRKLRTPVYVVGTPAPFGRQEAYVRYVDPDPAYDQTPQWLPVRQGPESLYPERLKLGAIGSGDFNGPTLDSGFGPYALTRLAATSGGFYIAVHPFRVEEGRARRRSRSANMTSEIDYFFDSKRMRRYRPDYVPLKEYQKRLAENDARAALVRAAEMTWSETLGNIRRNFPNLDEAQFAEDLTRAQRAAALIEPQLVRIVQLLRTGERDRPKLESPRWQAGFDLAMGRALAAKVRAEGYNASLARAKQGMAFSKERSDTWLLKGSEEILTGNAAQAEAEEATTYLTRVVEEHPGTPWALLAERELRQPLGWAWEEAFRNLRAQQERQRNNQNQPPRPENDPPEPRRRPPPKL